MINSQVENMQAVEIILASAGLIALLFLAIVDFRRQIVPNKVLIMMLIFRLLLYFTPNFSLARITADIFNALFFGGFFFFLALFSKSALGMGDVKLMCVLPLYFGLKISFGAIIIAFGIILIISILQIITKKWSKTTQIPLVPYFAVGFLLSTILQILT